MICKRCAEAGDRRKEDPQFSAELHDLCQGSSWCDCMHVVDGEWVNWWAMKSEDSPSKSEEEDTTDEG